MRQSNLPLVLAATAVLVLSVLCVLYVFLVLQGRITPRTPLAYAAAEGSPGQVQSLLEGGAPPESATETFSPLIWAARADRVESVHLLLEAGADPDRQDNGRNGWPPLLHAVHTNAPGAVRELLAAGADVNQAAPSGLTPLMMAAGESKKEIFELLLAAGADPYARKDGDETVLTYAVLGGDAAIVRSLRKKAPDLRMRNTMEDWGARSFAWVRGRSEVLKEVGR